MMMIRIALTTLAISVAAVYAAEQQDAVSSDGAHLRGGAIVPELIGAEQLVDVEAHCVGCQPDYCYDYKGAVADYFCYR
jgi:hypothetical protein